jgi:hypothetical protein
MRQNTPSCQQLSLGYKKSINMGFRTTLIFQQNFARYRNWHSKIGIYRETYQKMEHTGGNKLFLKLSASTVKKMEDDTDTPPDSSQPSAMSWD